MDGSVLEEKSSFKMLGFTFSSKLDCGSYVISIAKTGSKKIGSLIHSMKFLSREVALYLYKSTIQPCIEYTVLMSGLVLLVDTWNCSISYKRICRTTGSLLAASLEPLALYRNIVSLSLLYRYCFDRYSEPAQLIPLPCSQGRSNCYSDRLHIFLSPFLDVTRISMSTVCFFAQLDYGILCL